MIDSYVRIFIYHFICRPMLVHGMTLVSFGLFRKNLGNLREFFGQMVHRPPWQKIARTLMHMRSISLTTVDSNVVVSRGI